MAEIFSTVLRGYKKEEVTSYIADLSEQMQLLKNDLDSKDVEIDRLKKELATMEDQPSVPDETEMEALRVQIKAELEEEYAQKLAAKEAELQALNAEQPDVGDLERKAKEYDECKDALADLMIQARRNADDIVENAKAKAQMLQAKAEMEFAQLNTSFSLLLQNVGNVRSEIQVSLDNVSDQVAAFEQKIAEIQTEVEATIGSSSEEKSEA